MTFQPRLNQVISIRGKKYYFAENPAPEMAGEVLTYERRQASVYKLVPVEQDEDSDEKALKVFKEHFRKPWLASHAVKVAKFAKYDGLSVCKRLVLTPKTDSDLVVAYSELLYAVLMPWMDGHTWEEKLAEEGSYSKAKALHLARSLASALMQLQEEQIAHCDISGANVIVNKLQSGNPAVEFVDIEGLYHPELSRPAELATGSPGYAHKVTQEDPPPWGPAADRFAGAVLICEMLALADHEVMSAAWGDSYFAPEKMQQHTAGFEAMDTYLETHWGANLSLLFQRAWASETLEECPTFAEWFVSLPKAVPQAQTAPRGRSVKGASPSNEIQKLISEGETRRARGQREQALAYFQEALSMAPGDKSIQVRVADLKEQISQDNQWICACCEKRVEAEYTICTWCEKGEKGKPCKEAKPVPPHRKPPVLIYLGLAGIAGATLLWLLGGFGGTTARATETPAPSATATDRPIPTTPPTRTQEPILFSCSQFQTNPRTYTLPSNLGRLKPGFPNESGSLSAGYHYSIEIDNVENNPLDEVHEVVSCFPSQERASDYYSGKLSGHDLEESSSSIGGYFAENSHYCGTDGKYVVVILTKNLVLQIKGLDNSASFSCSAIERSETPDFASYAIELVQPLLP